MKIAVVGSRTFKDYSLLKSVLFDKHITLLISGGAGGADHLAEEYASDNNLPTLIIPADWENLKDKPCKIKCDKQGKLYNSLAGFNRNKKIVEAAELVIAFWDGRSPGTKNTIEHAKTLGKKVEIYQFNGEK